LYAGVQRARNVIGNIGIRFIIITAATTTTATTTTTTTASMFCCHQYRLFLLSDASFGIEKVAAVTYRRKRWAWRWWWYLAFRTSV
jgi:hypothetical protein